MEMASATHYSQRGSQRINSRKPQNPAYSARNMVSISMPFFFAIILLYCGFGTFV
jgi:hypothetical protein